MHNCLSSDFSATTDSILTTFRRARDEEEKETSERQVEFVELSKSLSRFNVETS